ncbi:MAG: TrmH family RNA methyltransferase [Candidatus Vogelbacteria bacterium]|nr:TrmH family RNA methyltransferase [Candidatus Vogelbacteria bacterium]
MVKTKEIFLILHNVRSSQNVGAIFRVADAAGASKIYLTGYTPTPRDRFGRANRALIKTALGAENYVAWEKMLNVSRLLKKLSDSSFQLLALEQSNKSIDYRKINLTRSTAVIVGNEVRGLSKQILGRCDTVVEIPMRGRKESLNVAVALSVFLFGVVRV